MFCKKKPPVMPMVMKTVGCVLAAVGVVTLTTWVLAKCGCLGSKAKRMAKKCELAVQDAAESVGEAVHTTVDRMTTALGTDVPTDCCDACPLPSEEYHLPTCNAPRA